MMNMWTKRGNAVFDVDALVKVNEIEHMVDENAKRPPIQRLKQQE